MGLGNRTEQEPAAESPSVSSQAVRDAHYEEDGLTVDDEVKGAQADTSVKDQE